jgi:trehalose synthase-fused probable maltokinase
MVARIDQQVDELYSALPQREVLAPIAGREAEIRSRLRHLAGPGNLGRRIRDHGDLHLGQALWWEDDWMVIDFEGEPARSLAERRVKRSPLRDVAGIFRSFAYAAAVGGDAARAGDPLDPWQREAREAFLDGYLAEVGQAGLLPSSPAATEELLALFELEKAVYEVRYEAAHRPDWLWIPVAGLSALLDRPGLS